MTEPAAPAADPADPAPTIRPSLGWLELGVAALSYVVVQLALAVVAGLLSEGVPSAPVLVAISGVSALAAVAIALSLRVRSRAAVGLVRVPVRTVLVGIGLGVVVWLVSRALILAYVAITGDASDPQAALTLFSGPVAATLVVLIGGLVVPLGEELLFRGVGYGVLRRLGQVVAVVLSAGVFALAHGLNVVFAAALLLGVVNAVLYERTGSIWPPVAAHATFNLISFALVLAVGGQV
ncbi:CPBP family intramembrane glutamic endopeptidase [Actinomycetospora chibensis]|uniref:CPBP family intramembrane glutamic endopeptidase n=1 Tax=Actinomycetospora chibensis TaxID=663606 RepID=A0ABV9RQP1_9PSEU|nr:CPBP family intramembrane glutamic endopeptidase [Actinomycetospora chibensis]MDD7925357.1 CPBP family intramembrane metalloprotease [Actinomycetospora chibensis]